MSTSRNSLRFPVQFECRCASLLRFARSGVLLVVLMLASGLAAAASYTASWTQLSTSNTPGAPAWRGWTAMTWVGSENRIVMWGGSGAVFMNDVVGLDPVSGGWTTFEPSTNCPGNTQWAPPNGSDENGVVHDPLNDQLWLYNGGSGYRCATTAAVGRIAGAGTTSTAIVDPTLPSNVTDYYKDWTVRSPNGTKVRVNAYHAGTKTLTLSAALPVSAGGAYDLYVDFGDGTWSYSFVTGQYDKLASRHFGYNGYVPPARKSPGFAGDATRAILFGGADFDNGTYKLDFATRSYSVALAQGLSTSPPARGQIPHQFVYDSVHGRFVLFGGRCFDPGRCSYQNMLDDTWIYNANTNAWTQVTAALRPAARNQGQMYFDAAKGVVVLYGGMGNNGTLLNDLWTFDVATLAWTQQAQPPTNPGGIYLGQIAYAPTTQCGYLVYGLRAGATVANGTWRLCLAPSGGGGNTPPLASFTTTPSTALVGASIAMSAAGSSDPGGSIVNYAWNFGDGTTGSGVNVSKAYATTGTKTVMLTVTDNGGLTATTTRTVTITAGNLPPVANFTATPSPTTTGTPIVFSGATSADPDGTIASYAWNFGDGTTGTGVSTSKSYATAGTYTVTLTVTDNGGLTGTTTGTVTVTAGTGVTTVWVEDALPAGAQVGGDEPFTWVSANPAPFSGALAHQSALRGGTHTHGFVYATAKLTVGAGDVLFAYVYLDPANPPREVLLQWHDGTWEHRAYWGDNLIPLPAKSGPWNRYMGPLPPTGQWVRLEVPASAVELEGSTLDGMAFVLYDGRATWDRAGKVSGLPPTNQPPVASFTTAPATATVGSSFTMSGSGSSDPDGSITQYAWSFGDGTTGTGVTVSKAYNTPGTFAVTLTVTDNGGLTSGTTRLVTVTAAGSGTTTVWVDDALPAGAIAGGSESFAWVGTNPPPFSGTLAHQSTNAVGIHQHYFGGATATLSLGTGDKLFVYVYLDPVNPPREVMLQFFDGTWEHRAFWGDNLIPWGGAGNTNSGRYMGALPAAGQWVRLEVPAAQVGLEGRTLTGMAFALYDGKATWDRAGKLAP